MSSDDDQPLLTAHARNGHHSQNGAHSSDAPMTSSPPKSSRKRKLAISDSSEDDDTPLASTAPLKSKTAAVPMPGAIEATTVPASNGVKSTESDSDDDVPLTKRKQRPPAKKKKVKAEESDVDMASETDDPPPKKAPPKRKRGVKKEVLSDMDSSDSSADEKPIAKKPVLKKNNKSAKVKAESSPPPKNKGKAKPKEEANGKKAKKEEEDEEEVYKWWEEGAQGDDSVKWTTLEHNGVFFPPPYEPLPSNVKMNYKGKPVTLHPAAEEVAGFYAAMLETDHAKDVVFNKNFFEDWRRVLKANPCPDKTDIKDFDQCDFRPMFEHFEAERAKKKAMTAAEKKEAKKRKDEMETPYMTCVLDGRKEKVGNFRVEPPGLFRGRGEHPKKGCLKLRVRPEDITINVGKDAKLPVPNVPGKWKSVIHDNTVTWLANWTENVNGNNKYVFLAAGSSLKGQSDMAKFEKARELKNHVERIRADYQNDLKSKVMADRQRATTMYFIDKLALRAGNEKGEDEADTVGCCSLRCEHVTLEAPNFIIFDFLGKDSIRYYNKVVVEAQVYKNIRIFKENKEDGDNLFDRVSTSSLNKHLTSYMKGLTAKVFRTYNASITFQRLLDEGSLEGATLQEKLNAYNHANRMVAILCNHQRSAPKTHEQSMEKARHKIRAIKYERMKLRHALFATDKKYKKNKKYTEDESDIDDEFIEAIEKENMEKEIEKAEKKFAKDNEKLAEEQKELQDESVLKEKIKDIKADFKRLEKERGTKEATLKRAKPAEKIEEAIDKLTERIKTQKLQMQDRDAGKEVALGTSKINYLDPRITSAWCKTHEVPIEKLFSKTLMTKFPWAMEVDEDWKF